jgi:two-component system sensor histidine kinase UhpB
MPPRLLARRRTPAERPNAPAAQPGQSSHRLLRVQEEERQRIRRELHDGLGQGLMVLRLHLETGNSGSQLAELQSKVQEALRLIDSTIEDLRRIIGRLSPRTLEELGLPAAVRKEARDLSRNTGMRAQLAISTDLRALGHELEIGLYRSLQEALHNIAKHSQAQNFRISLEHSGTSVSLLVEDDGIGFSGKHDSGHPTFGLLGMRERITALGGRVRIQSGKGTGTRIKIVVPLPTKPGRQAAPERRLPPAFDHATPARPGSGRVSA